jgi:5'-methylthioadenosine phosphorylase
MDNYPLLAVIGGSGLYDMAGLKDRSTFDPVTPFGKTSAPVILGSLEGKQIAFLARHGIGHTLNPGEINYKANIYALKMLGIRKIVSISACGSLREDYSPGNIVIPDQLIDFTRLRKRTFFEDGCVAHISSANPYCSNSGTLITIEGPRFSTRAESNLFRSWGMSIIGMTACPEAFLAREAEMCYITIAHVTDYDVWHISEEPVNVDMVIRTLHKNTQLAQESIRNILTDPRLDDDCEDLHSLENAVITQPDAISIEAKERLDLFLSKYQK